MGLYPDQREALPMEDVVAGMRRRIVVDIVQGDAFQIAYEGIDPTVAMQVTDRLAGMFITENLREREVLASGTSSFLEGQLEGARQELIAHEGKLEEYRRRYSGQLPTQLATNLQALQSLQLQLQSVSDSLSRDRDQLQLVERIIDDVFSNVLALEFEPVDSPGEIDRIDAPAIVRLRAARNALATLELRFLPSHPDILRMNRLIGELEQEAARAEAAGEGSLGAEEAPLTPELDSGAAEPAPRAGGRT